MDNNIVSEGNTSYKGYDYQIAVTAWVALTLLVDSDANTTNEIIVEPASNEDIEVNLNVPPDEALATILVPQAEKLMIQIKFRGSGYWSSKAFAALVEDKPKKGAQGPSPRLRAKSLLLSDPDRRYVLVTNIGVDTPLSKGRVERVDISPPKSFLPPEIASGPKEKEILSGHFSFVESLTPKLLSSELRRLLESAGHVPSTRVVKAIENLKRAIADRLLGLSSPLTRGDVMAIIESAGGFTQIDRELSEYVPPISADLARQILQQENAVLLIGPPGYGKSLTAKQLVMEHRLENPPFEVVRQTSGIEGIDEFLRAPGRHIIYLDDPWGQSKIESDADRWSIELPRLLRRASTDKKFVVTSRTDILRLAFVELTESPWDELACSISKDSYDDNSRWAILMRKLKDGGSWRKDFVYQYRSNLLRSLESPLALDRFAKALLDVSSADKADFYKLVEQAQIESIRRIVAEQVKGWPCHGVACATILWSLLRRGGKASPERLKMLRISLEKSPTTMEINLEGFVDHFKPISLHSEDDGTFTAHGKVVDALEQVVKHYRVEAERTINKVLLAYENLRRSDDAFVDDMFHLVDAVHSVKTSGIEIEPAVRSRIDAFLIDRLTVSEGRAFSRAFRDVISLSSETHPLARLVKYLGVGAPRQNNKGLGDFGWKPPQLSATEVAAICSEPCSHKVAAMFISTLLPFESEDYDADDLLGWLKPFNFELSVPFLEACRLVTTQPGFLMNSDTVIKCALIISKSPPYDEVFILIERLEVNVIEAQKKLEDRADPWQGELDFAHQLHLQDDLEEEGSAVSHAVDGYVRARRYLDGYKWIPSHPRPDLIMPAWAEAMTYESPKVTIEEVNSFLATADTPYMQARGLRVIGDKKLHAGIPILISVLEQGSSEEREAAIRALQWMKNKQAVENMIIAAMDKTDVVGQIELLVASSNLATYKKDKIALMQRLSQKGPPASKDFLELITLANADVPGTEIVTAFQRLDAEVVKQVMMQAPLPIARFLLSISAHEGHDITEIAKRWLVSDDNYDVMAAVDALRRVGTSEARALIAGVIDHIDYKVRRSVIDALAPDATVDEMLLILRFASDRSAPVRERLAEAIGANHWDTGLPVLLTLLHDKRDYSRHTEFDARTERRFKVARAAARALEYFDSLPDNVIDDLFSFVSAGNNSSRDIEFHALIVSVLASSRDDRIVTILCKLLSDGRVVGNKNENLYPVRYAAAWGLVHQLSIWAECGVVVDWDAVERGAIHSDPQLAAPCLWLIGTRLTDPTPGMLTVLRSDETSESRRVLALMGMNDLSAARTAGKKYGLFPPNHPFMIDEADLVANTNGWPVTKSFDLWLRSLDAESDVEGVILKIAASEMDTDLGVNDFNATALRRKTSIPITSLSEMFGME